MPATVTIPSATILPTGSPIEARCRYDGQWADGFVVDDSLDAGYRVRRRLDGQILPSLFSVDEIRPA